MKHKILNNIGLKILALIGAIVLWLIVVNINDPEITTTFRKVPVTVKNESVLLAKGLTYLPSDNGYSINVTVTGKKSVVNALSNSDIHVVADLNSLGQNGTTVPLEVSIDRYNSEVELSPSADNLDLKVEALASKQLFITAGTTGAPSEGYMVGTVTGASNVVQLSGPKSLIEEIEYADAIVDVTGTTSNISTAANVNLYKHDGSIVTNTSVTKNITTVNVSVQILVVMELPIRCDVMGSPVEGYAWTGEIICEPAYATVACPEERAATLKEISIPAETLNITGQAGDMTVSVNYSQYLPDDVILANESMNGKCMVTVKIEPEETKLVTLDWDKIEFKNVPEGVLMSVFGEGDDLSISLSGSGVNLSKVNAVANSLGAELDFELAKKTLGIKKYQPGENYTIPLTITVPEGTRLTKDVVLIVSFSEDL